MRLFEATAEAGVVKVGDVTIGEALILSGGVGDSEGILLIQEGKAYYIASSANDLSVTLENAIQAFNKVKDSLTKIGTILTSIGAGMTGPTTAPPPTLAVDVAVISTNVAALTTAISQLSTLKDELI